MADILDELPLGEAFDWVGRVSIDLATQFIIDRNNPRKHVSFGFGVHR